ncbi:MAG: endonuclease III [Candidatus Bathyarchaeota archaeon]|nr:endonuclease III [Candidatus Bathyarchaeota archaeon]
MTKERAATVLQILKQTLALPSWTKSRREPFETLVVTIISQNTADRNTARAFETLSKSFEISPEALAKAPLNQIEGAIKTAGLYKSKAAAIQHASRIVLEKYEGTLQPLLDLPLEQAREALMQFPGVGPKTADVVLLFSARQSTVPVDTHVNRVAKRLGFAPPNGDYEAVRCSLQALFDAADYLAVHLLFITHGRKTCKAPRPLCGQCPVNAFCPSNGKWSSP